MRIETYHGNYTQTVEVQPMNQAEYLAKVVDMVQESVRRDARRPQEIDRQVARLAHIIEDWNVDGCYEHSECRNPECLAKEIIMRQIAWD